MVNTPSDPARQSAESPQELPVELIDPDPYQSRTRDDPAALAVLKADIAVRGVLEPVRVRPAPAAPGRYRVFLGGRRVQAVRELHAADLERWSVIPAYVEMDKSDADALADSWAENLVRKDLTALEEGRVMLRLLQLKGWTQRRLADDWHLDYGYVRQSVAGTRIVLASPILRAANDQKPFPRRLVRAVPKEPELQETLARIWRGWKDGSTALLIRRIAGMRRGDSVEEEGALGAVRTDRIERCCRDLQLILDQVGSGPEPGWTAAEDQALRRLKLEITRAHDLLTDF